LVASAQSVAEPLPFPPAGDDRTVLRRLRMPRSARRHRIGRRPTRTRWSDDRRRQEKRNLRGARLPRTAVLEQRSSRQHRRSV